MKRALAALALALSSSALIYSLPPTLEAAPAATEYTQTVAKVIDMLKDPQAEPKHPTRAADIERPTRRTWIIAVVCLVILVNAGLILFFLW